MYSQENFVMRKGYLPTSSSKEHRKLLAKRRKRPSSDLSRPTSDSELTVSEVSYSLAPPNGPFDQYELSSTELDSA